MRAPWKRAAAITLATCGFSFLPMLSGCKSDVEKTDAQIAGYLDEATGKLETTNPQDVDAAQATLAKAVSVKNSSPTSQIDSNSLLAQAESDAADHLVGQIVEKQSAIASIISQMDQLGAQLAINNINVAGYRKLEPTPGLDAIKKQTANAQTGAEGGAWIPGQAPVPSLATVKKNEDDLQKQIQDLTAKRDELDQKRAQALQEADKFSRQSESTQGKDSVGFYTQAAAQRKEAADDQANIDLLNGQITNLQQDLAVAKLQQQTIEEAVAGFEQQAQSLQKGWGDIQKQIENATAFSTSLLGSTGGGAATQPTATLAMLSTQLDAATKEVQDLRTKAAQLLNQAFKHYQDADKIANQLEGELMKQARDPNRSKLPEKRAWESLMAANQSQGFKLKEAGVQGRLARLYADQFVELQQLNKLAQMLAVVLKQAAIATPPPLAGIASFSAQIPPEVVSQASKIEQDASKEQYDFDTAQTALDQLAEKQTAPAAQQQIAATRSTLSYARADSLLRDVTENPGQGDTAQQTADLAHAARMVLQYGWMQLALARDDKQHADGHFSAAKQERDAVQAKALLPAVLPPGLALPISTQPTTAPTTAPSGEPPTTAPTETPATAPTETPATAPAENTGSVPATAPATAPETAAPAPGTEQPGAQQAPPPAPLQDNIPPSRRRRTPTGR